MADKEEETGYADGGELSEAEFNAGVALTNAIQAGKKNLSRAQQLLLRRFVMGVNAHQSRIKPLSKRQIDQATKDLTK